MAPLKLVVVGGGIAGLAAAHRAVELARERATALDLTLIEARERLGGTIATERADGFLVEAGPDSFLSEKPWALALCRRLGVEDRLVRTDDRFRKVFVWHRGRLHPLPDGFQLLAPTALAAVRHLVALLVARQAAHGARPRAAARHGRRREPGRVRAPPARREALERVAQPLVAGIYTADPDDLTLTATMPRFIEVERRERSIILGLRRALRRAPLPGTSGARWSLFVTFADGMEEMVTALAARLPPGAVLLKQRVGGSSARPGLARGRRSGARARGRPRDRGDRVPHREPAAALPRSGAGHAARGDPVRVGGDRLARLSARGRAARARRLRLRGPAHRGPLLLACTFSSVKYPGRAPEGHVLLRGFLGGMLNAGMLETDDDALIAGRATSYASGSASPPSRCSRACTAGRRRCRSTASATSSRRDDRAPRRGLPGLRLAGAAYRGVGIADCVRSGEAAAEQIFGAL